MSATLRAALELAELGWPVLPIREGDKTPATVHGVKDASTDPDRIRAWFTHRPALNLAVATGHPGPQVLDVDDLAAAPAFARTSSGPQVATTRGRHLYFAGTANGTVALGYGELRGRGSYVLCPPSRHPSGREYVWLARPDGPLPQAPAQLVASRAGTAGRGEHRPPTRGRVPHHQRHPYLRDFAVRLARSGVTDPGRLLAHLRLEFEISCDPSPAPAPGSLEAIAAWAVRSRIAGRERTPTAAPALSGAWWARRPGDPGQ